MAKVTKLKTGKLSPGQIRALLHKEKGDAVSYDLSGANPTEVTEWIPTGSRWLDSIICKGKLAGIPLGKIVEISGLEASGKSFMAAQIAANAQSMGIDVVYFDSESALSGDFLVRSGCDLENLHYIPASSVEMVLETIERLLETDNKWLFIWDSLAMTPCKADIESDYNPQSTMAVKPRVLSKGFQKLTVPLAKKDATVLVLNQLRTNIGARTPAEALINPYFTPGGKTVEYIYSLRVWLTARKAKASYLVDENGYRIGTEVTAKIKKSRFGSEGRTCKFKILWGDLESVGIQDRESWFDAIYISDSLKQSGAWFSLVFEDGTEKKFQRKNWLEMLQDPSFEKRVLQIMDEDVIMKFKDRSGAAANYYDEEIPPVES